MQYRIRHSTTYTYSVPVSVCHNLVMLTPREDEHVKVLHHRIETHPAPQYSSRRKDAFGNQVHVFSIEENHKQLSVVANHRVEVIPRTIPEDPGPPWEQVAAAIQSQSDPDWLPACRFVFDSPRVQRSPEFRAYAQESFAQGRPILDALRDLTRRLHEDFRYDRHATAVATASDEAFRLRRGVCQDFAHVQLACLRSLGLPARYVSGYLRTVPPSGMPRLVGADQSHAWVSAYCGSAIGWVDVDPTNNCVCNTDHIPIAWGRDYTDVSPMRGVFLGGGEHQLKVSVDVSLADETAVGSPADSNGP